MFVKVRITSGSSTGKELTFRGKQFLVGRADECNLRPQSDTISRRHCLIEISETRASILDLGSRNGTIVNGNRADKPVELHAGDLVCVGALKFQIIECPQPATSAAAAATAKKNAKLAGNSGIIGDWLLEADKDAKIRESTAQLETRQYAFEDTDRIDIDSSVRETTAADTESQPTAAVPNAHPKKKLPPGKLPKVPPREDAPKDTQEAASQMLKKFWKRT
ncbi:MAG: FHA domain-containing protein [Planctomycetota bacterium]|nr:FHA domain-containing protein [Planctomycetota bacterium]MDA1180086.1 FHA domain-containing protein [Planctomycetota bacterium]